jgi:uncharacterized protein YbjT (DUF2867 family)
MKILVVGASGYVGGRLVPLLLERGHELVLLGRNVRVLETRFPQAKVLQGDLLEAESLPPSLEGVEVAYYLAHSMGTSSQGFAERDLQAAANFGEAAAGAGVGRIVYLGGLGSDDEGLSHHLTSRHETGAELARHRIPVTEFRAAIVIGSGSASFEILRHLAERLPIMITPRWVATRCQPIAIVDVLDYLVAAAYHPEITGIVEIGGPDVLSYGQMMLAYARQRRLRRWMIPVPVLTPRLSSYWVNLISPVPSSIARPLIEGLRNEVIVRDPVPARGFGLQPMSYSDALAQAIERTDRHVVESTWFDAYRHARREGLPENATGEGMLVDRRVVAVSAPAARVFAEVERLGGTTGWPSANLLWRIRGAADRVIGGVGMRLGRRDPDHVRVGDAVDFWRVEDVRPPELLRLVAEMKLPGRAWLQYEVTAARDGTHSTLVQTAFFEPHGLAGLAYWHGLAPIHPSIFRGMAKELAARATR